MTNSVADNLYSTVRTYADGLLLYARDNFGSRKTLMLINSVDTDTLKPEPVVNLLESQKGLTLLYDLYLLTGEQGYLDAVKTSFESLFTICKFPRTGLLAWGERMRYDVVGDSWSPARPEESRLPLHQFTEALPAVTVMAKTGFLPQLIEYAENVWKYHVFDKEGKAAYVELVNAESGEMIEHDDGILRQDSYHGAHLTYMFAYLYAVTGDKSYAERAFKVSNYIYSLRNKKTNLVPFVVDVRKGHAYSPTLKEYVKEGHVDGFGTKYFWGNLYAYRWTHDSRFLEIARKVVEGYIKYGFNYEVAAIDGVLLTDGTTEGFRPYRYYTWDTASASVKLWEYTRKPIFIEMARRAAEGISTAPATFDWGGFPYSHYEARILDLFLELYRVTSEEQYLMKAYQRTELILPHYLNNGLITNAPVGASPKESHVDVSYTNQGATHGCHELASQLLRLYLMYSGCNILTAHNEGSA